MSSLSTNSGHKHKKHKPASDDVDRISNLPESIIGHILSLLRTDDAIVTGFLSKKWKFLWRNIYNLDITDEGRQFDLCAMSELQDAETLFADFVNKMWMVFDEKSIDTFSLTINYFSQRDYDYISNWIATAVSRNAKVIDLRTISWPPTSEMPCSLFTSTTLHTLYLYGSYIYINLPPMVSLPNLKILQLLCVTYKCNESLSNLISGCSSLEFLEINRDEPDNVHTITISSPTLIKFEYNDIEDTIEEEKLLYKLEINAPRLRYLVVNNYSLGNISVENLCLDKAVINLEIDETLIGSESADKLLQGLQNATTLALGSGTLKLISQAVATPRFLRLTQLQAQVECYKFKQLVNLMEGLSNLEFYTKAQDDHECTHVTCWRKPERVPIRMLSCLKTMSIYHFEGRSDELQMVAYILKNSKVLRTVTIKIDESVLDLGKRYEVLQKISNFCRGSKNCRITFS